MPRIRRGIGWTLLCVAGAALLLHDTDWNACNSFDAPDRVMPRIQPVKLEGFNVRLDLPRMSVATVTLKP